MNLGNITLPKTAALAPMAGVADRAFREICISQGACYVVGEMCSAKGIAYGSIKSHELLCVYPGERPMAVQIFGDDPATMAAAAKFAAKYQPNAIDINMGCPVPKVAGNGSGSALMKTPALAGEIVKAVVAAAGDIPVTVKIRKGWDDTTVNAVEVALLAQEAGASAVAVHGRTKAQMYTPPVDLEIIARVKEALDIPVIGNGDILTPQDAQEMYRHTGCDLVMIGRGALGNPWLFSQITAYLATGELLPEPTAAQRMETLLRQIRLAAEYKGEYIALREARSHAAWYFKGMHGAADLRRRAGQLTTLPELEALAAEVVEHNS